jgi:hypothetical protein
MNTVTSLQINKVKKGLEKITREAKRRLFEFETLTNLYEVGLGKISRYKSAKSFVRSLAK